MVIGLGPGNIVLDADPAPHSKGTSPPLFGAMSIAAKLLPISAVAEHLLQSEQKLMQPELIRNI